MPTVQVSTDVGGRLYLPDGRGYAAGATVTLDDAAFASLSPAQARFLTVLDTSTNLALLNRVYLAGLRVKETDTGKVKTADGVTAYSALAVVQTPSGHGSDYVHGLNVADYVVGDGLADDTAGFIRALSAASTLGRPLIGSPNLTVKLTDIVTVLNGHRIIGNGLVLDIQTDHSSAGRYLHLDTVEDVRVSGLRIKCSNAAARNQLYGMLVVSSGGDIILEDIWVNSGEGTGIFTKATNTSTASGVSNLRIIRPRVTGTWADGIHVSRGASDVWVVNPLIYGTKDDCIAINSILTDDGTHNYNQIQRVHVIAPNVHDTINLGSGVVFLGTKDCTLTGGTATNMVADGGQIGASPAGNGSGTYTADGNTFTGFHTRGCTYGLVLGLSVDSQLIGSTAKGSTNYGIGLIGNVQNAFISGCRSTGNGGAGLYASGGSGNHAASSDFRSNTGPATNVDAGTIVGTSCVTV